MVEIELPFSPEMQKAALEGRKTCTSRNSQKGEVGDTFKIKTTTFRLTRVDQRSLVYVAYMLHDMEGFVCSQSFIDYYDSLYKKRGGSGYVPEKLVWVHWFKRVMA